MPFYRHHPRLGAEYYRGRGYYFVTICCWERRTVFADLVLGKQTLGLLIETGQKHSFLLHAYCLMPDHLHFLAGGTAEACDLIKFVNNFKQRSAFACRQKDLHPLWQGRFHEHILRTAEEIDGVGCYIWLNPVRKGICGDPRAYPLSGSQTKEWMGKGAMKTEWVPPWKMVTCPPGPQGGSYDIGNL